MEQIGIVGLAVMGSNLAANLASCGIATGGYSIDEKERDSLRDAFLALEVRDTPEELVKNLIRPRKVLLMVRWDAVEEVIERFMPLLEPDDIFIDGGNSPYQETERRTLALEKRGIAYLGLGISGGAQGARKGPSLMAGGSKQAYREIQPLLAAIAAKAPDGSPCVQYLGPGGAGHLTKTIHNGLEYGHMQLLAETYLLLRQNGLKFGEIARLLESWNSGKLGGYLLEITADILKREEKRPLLDTIRGQVGQKGTGTWSVAAALEAGIPFTIPAAALFHRFQSCQKSLDVPKKSTALLPLEGDILETALYGALLLLYRQGIDLLAKKGISPAQAVKTWRGGCILRCKLLEELLPVLEKQEDFLAQGRFKKSWQEAMPALRQVVAMGVKSAVPLPAFCAALAYGEVLAGAETGGNLLSAQRDYFGAHGFRLCGKEEGMLFHGDWDQPCTGDKN